MLLLKYRAALLLLVSAAAGLAAEPIFREDFEAAEVGKVPAGFMVMTGGFSVKEADGGKVLELPGSPLDSFGVLFGPPEKAGIAASARFFGTRQGRKFPTFGVSLGGAAGHRLQVSPARKALEIHRGDQVRSSVPFTWNSGGWTHLRIQIRPQTDGSWLVQGKAWPSEAAEPESWTIEYRDRQEPPAGRPGIWGSPYSGTPIQFDDLIVTPATAP